MHVSQRKQGTLCSRCNNRTLRDDSAVSFLHCVLSLVSQRLKGTEHARWSPTLPQAMCLALRAFCRATFNQTRPLHKYLTSTEIATATATATTPPTAAFRTVKRACSSSRSSDCPVNPLFMKTLKTVGWEMGKGDCDCDCVTCCRIPLKCNHAKPD